MNLEEQLRQTQDMLEGAINQRNAAQNECVTLNAQLKAALRRVAELEEAAAKLVVPPQPNGAAEAQA